MPTTSRGFRPAPSSASMFVDGGKMFDPFAGDQKEVGVKVDFGRVTTTVAAFEIASPSLIRSACSPNARQAPDGEQRNRGIEINTFGEIAPGLRLLGGVAFIDGRLTKTEGGKNDGHKAQGVADVDLNIGVDWDTPFIPGLTVGGRVIYTSEPVHQCGEHAIHPGIESARSWRTVYVRRTLE